MGGLERQHVPAILKETRDPDLEDMCRVWSNPLGWAAYPFVHESLE